MHWSGRAPLSLRVWGCADGCGQPGASIAVPTRLDGGAVHPEADAQAVGRGAVCALAGEPLLPILLRRAELLPQPAVRPLVTDALAPAAGRGAAGSADPGEPVGGVQDR